jgi:CTP synthase (UTP-ammonia lyase)
VLEQQGMVISGTSPDDVLVEMVELPRDRHPYFIASQAHPEFKSRANRAHPLFRGHVAAMIARQERAESHGDANGNGADELNIPTSLPRTLTAEA